MSNLRFCVVAWSAAHVILGVVASVADAATSEELICVASTASPPASVVRIEPSTGVLRVSSADLRVQAGAISLDVYRVFETDAGTPGLLGRGWRLNWEQRLTRKNGLAGVRGAAGTLLLRQEEKSETYRSSAGNAVTFSAEGALHILPDGRREKYDAQGRLVELDARNGNTVRVEYDAAGRLTQVTGPFGSFVKFTIDARGRLTQVESSTAAVVRYFYGDDAIPADASGRRIVYAYDDGLRLASLEQPQSGLQRFTYDVYGRVTERRFADDAVERLAYDDAEHTVQRTDAAGRTSTLREAADGLSVELTTPGGARSRAEFDAQRRLVAVTGPTGVTARATYDEQSRLTRIENPVQGTYAVEYRGESRQAAAVAVPDGRRLTFDRDAQGNLTGVKYDGETEGELHAEYRSDGLLQKLRRRGGREFAFAYDDRGRLQSVTDPMGNQGRFEYDDAGRLLRYTDPLGAVVARSYDDVGRPASVTNAIGGVTRFEYDAAGRPVKVFDPLGGATGYGYDARGRLTARTDPLGHSVRYAYHSDGRLQSTTDAAGGLTRFEYDADGRPARRINAAGGADRFTFDALGNVTGLQTASGATLKATYDELGRRTDLTDSAGNVVKYQYDRLGRVVGRTDPYGRTTQYEYDARGNPVKATYPIGRVVARKYDAADRVVEVAVDERPRANYEYDAAGNVTRIKYAAGLEVAYRYDPLGRVNEWQDSLGGRGKIVRDPEGRPIEQVDAAGAIMRRRFDAAGRLVESTDALGRSETRAYDAAGRMIEFVAPNGDATKYEYDAAGRVAKVRTSGGGEKTYQYDPLGLPIRAVNPLGQVSRKTFDSAGRLVTSTDAAGRTTTLVYDAIGRLAERRRSDGTSVRYRYDDRGRIAEIDDGAFPVRYAYDDHGRRTEIEYPAIKQTIRYAYDRGRLESVAAAGRTTRYTYDDWDRLATLDAGDGAIRFGYDPRGRRTSVEFPNGVKAVREFDAVGRVKKLVYADRAGQPISGGEYVYDPIGNEMETVEVGGAVTIYGYDAVGQLLTEDRGAKGRTMYAYAPGGNRTERITSEQTIVSQYDRADRLVKAGDESFTFDDVGRLTERKGPRGTTSYEYDADGRLAGVALPDGRKVTYGYAPTGERVWREEAGRRIWYLSDGLEVLAELGGDLSVQATYVQGPGIDQVLALTRSGRTLYAHADRRGSVRTLTDAEAKPAATYEYDAFGRILAKEGDATSPFTFTGREFDEATGLYYFRARWYDPALGRFLTRDPIAGRLDEPLSLNPYQYVLNNPLSRIDPLGTEGVNPNVTMDSPPAITMDTPPAVTMDTPPGLAPTMNVPPELAPTIDVPLRNPNVTIDTPLGSAATINSPPTMRPIQIETLSGPMSPFQIDIMMRQLLYDPNEGRWGTKQDIINFLEVFRAEGHYDPQQVNQVIENVRTGRYDPFWNDMFYKPGGAPPETLGPLPEPAPPPAVEAPVPVETAPVGAAAAAEEAGIWSRLANGVRGAVEGFFEPKASAGNIAGGVGGGIIIGGNVMIDVIAEDKPLDESLKDQGIAALIAAPVVIVVTALGGGEVLLVAGVGATIKRGYDALSGEATVLPGEMVTDRDKPLRPDGVTAPNQPVSTTGGSTGPPPVGGPRRPLTPAEMADLNRYLQGLTGPDGTAMIAVPSVIGYPVQSALPMLIEAKLAGKPLVGKEAPTEKQQFQVYYQNPGGGTLVAAGTAVEVTFYYKAKPDKETVKVPNLVGLSRAEADAALAKVKLTGSGTAGKEKPPTSAKREQVYAQNPKAETEVFVGDAVKYDYYAGIPVGKYVGLTKDQAVQEITALGLKPVVLIGEARAAKESDRLRIYQQNPQPGAYAWFDDPVEITHYKNSEGFQDGDGNLVDGRVAKAVVKDGDGGPRSIIEYTLLPAGNPELNHTVMWKLEKFATAGAAAAKYGEMAAAYKNVQPYSDSNAKVEVNVGAAGLDVYTDLNTSRAQQTSKQQIFIYRGQFLVLYIYQVPQYKADISHTKTVVDKSKKLIDLRFPEN